MDIPDIVTVAMGAVTLVMLVVVLILLRKTYTITRRVTSAKGDQEGAKK